MDGRHFLCISFFFALIQSALAAEDVRKNHLNADVAHLRSTSDSPGPVNEEKPIGIFSRRRSLSPQRQHVVRPRPEKGRPNPGTVQHCARLLETCSAHTPCCNPCALCHCRIFNTICQCRRIDRTVFEQTPMKTLTESDRKTNARMFSLAVR